MRGAPPPGVGAVGEGEVDAVQEVLGNHTDTPFGGLSREEVERRDASPERALCRIRSRGAGLWAVFHPDGRFLWWEGECEDCGGTAVSRYRFNPRVWCVGCNPSSNTKARGGGRG